MDDLQRNREKIAISLPSEALEILDLFCNYYNMKRSSAIAFLIVRGLSFESSKTDGFSFDSVYSSYVDKDGKEVVLKRSDIEFVGDKSLGWVYSLGKNNQGKSVIVDTSDFEVDIDEK